MLEKCQRGVRPFGSKPIMVPLKGVLDLYNSVENRTTEIQLVRIGSQNSKKSFKNDVMQVWPFSELHPPPCYFFLGGGYLFGANSMNY